MQPQQSPRIGTLVVVRQERWRVIDVQPHAGCSVIALAGAVARNAGRVAQVIVPFDHIEPVEARIGIRVAGTGSWRRRCRSALAAQGPADRLQTAVAADIDLLPHQLEPALAMVRGQASRLLIADEVGLGKTVQAGLIVAELRARQAADRVLILTPAGLREQWANELKARFRIDAAVVDMRAGRVRAATLPVGVNPWSTMDVAIASFDFVKRPEVAPAVTSCPWDLVIVDEAHGVSAGSERRAIVDALCRHASYVVLLTATPHSGSRAAFRAICSIGAHPSDLFLVFRRNRADAGLATGRSVHRLFVRPTSAEGDMHECLAGLTRAVTAEATRSRDAWLTMSVLVKRSLSSANALAETIARRLRALSTDSAETLQLCLPLNDPTGDFDADDEAPAVLGPLLRNSAGERRLLTRLAERAARAARAESKLARLRRLLARLRRRLEPSIVFTEYRDTLLRLRHSLPFDCAVLHGGLTREERRLELDSFVHGRRSVLLATDAGSEGLNLQTACRVVINLELPWNPMRLEQRIGRVDRIGQRRRVHVFHLVARETPEVQILESLKAKIARARADIDAADPLGLSPQVGDGADVIRGMAGLGSDAEAADGEPDSSVPFELARFEVEAAREARRLVDARRYSRGNGLADNLPDDRWCAAATRHPRTRQALHGRCLVMLQERVSSAHGHLIASRLLPLLVSVGSEHPPGDRRRRLLLVGQAAQDVAMRGAGSDWVVEMQRLHRLFTRTRMARDSAILASLEGDATLVQTGLFEQRGLREAAERAARQAELTQRVSSRLRAFSASATEAAAGMVLMLIPAERW